MKTGIIKARGLAFPTLEAGEGPLVLCLHGFPDHRRSFRHQLPALAAAGFRAVAPAMRGYAPEAVPADGCYQTAALATDVVHVRGRLHVPVSAAEAKLRYRSPAVGTTVAPTAGGFRLELARPVYGVAPGQAAVLYDDGAVVGAGTIVTAETTRRPSAF